MRRPSSSAVLTQARIIVDLSSDAPTPIYLRELPSQRVPSEHTPFWRLAPQPPRAPALTTRHGRRQHSALLSRGSHPGRPRERPDTSRRAHGRAVLPVGLDPQAIHLSVPTRVQRGGRDGVRGRRRRRRDAGGSRRVRVDAGGPAGSPRGATQAARRAHDTHARDGRAGAIRSWLFVFSKVLPTRPYRALSRLCATSPPRTCSRRPRWTQPRANTPVGSASGRCSSRYCGGCTRRSWTRSLYLRQGEVYTLLCFSFVFVLDVVSMRCPLSSPCLVVVTLDNSGQTPGNRAMQGETKTHDASPCDFFGHSTLPPGRHRSRR